MREKWEKQTEMIESLTKEFSKRSSMEGNRGFEGNGTKPLYFQTKRLMTELEKEMVLLKSQNEN